jgi:hypothetical protein
MTQDREKAADLPVRLADGTEGYLSDFWKSTPVALVFLRHFG